MAEVSQWNRPKKDAGGGRGATALPNGKSAYMNRKGRPFARGLFAALVVVIVGVLAFYFICGRQGAADPAASRPAEKKRGKIAEVEPAKVAKAAPKAKKEEKMHFGVPHSEWVKLSHAEKVALGQAAYDAEAAKIDSTYLERKRAHDAEIASRPFKHMSENVIASILTLEPGDHVLMGDFHPTLQEDFLKSLNEPIIINADDSEEVKNLKQDMIEIRPQIKKLIDEGHTLPEILDDYRQSIAKVQQLEFDLCKELDEIKRTATSVDDVKDYIVAANEMMLKAGAKSFTYHLSEGAIRKILINAERAEAAQTTEGEEK